MEDRGDFNQFINRTAVKRNPLQRRHNLSMIAMNLKAIRERHSPQFRRFRPHLHHRIPAELRRLYPQDQLLVSRRGTEPLGGHRPQPDSGLHSPQADNQTPLDAQPPIPVRPKAAVSGKKYGCQYLPTRRPWEARFPNPLRVIRNLGPSVLR